MIYKILCDGNLIHNPQSMMDELALNNIKLNLEINAAGSLSFDIERSHYYYDSLYLSAAKIRFSEQNTKKKTIFLLFSSVSTFETKSQR